MHLLLDRLSSPVGTILLVCDGDALHALDFGDDEERMRRLLDRRYSEYWLASGRAPAAIRTGINGYFEGEFESLNRLPVETGGMLFQRLVWSALREIPAGTTVTY